MPLRLLFIALLAAACDRAPRPVASAAIRPELTLEKMTLRVYRNGTAHLLVRAEHLELMRSSGELTAQNAQFDFFVDALTLDAPKLTGNLNSLKFDATGGVKFTSSHPDPSSHFLARTPSAHFEAREGARGIATGLEPVDVAGLQSGRPFALTAQRFRFDVEAQHATFEAVQSKVGTP